jgi:hypothetical protein
MFFLKVLIAAFVIAAVSELAKRYSLWASILASLPLTSLLAIIFLHLETKDSAKIISLSNGILLALVPSCSFFIVISLSLNQNMSFWGALFIACSVTVLVYYLYFLLLRKLGVQIYNL